MRAVVQRVTESAVRVDGETVGEIGRGLLVLLGVADGDSEKAADFLARKIVHLRIFEDENGKMNRSLVDIGGGMLVVSQFTLLGDCKKGRRPSFVKAAGPDRARPLYEHFTERVRKAGVPVAPQATDSSAILRSRCSAVRAQIRGVCRVLRRPVRTSSSKIGSTSPGDAICTARPGPIPAVLSSFSASRPARSTKYFTMC